MADFDPYSGSLLAGVISPDEFNSHLQKRQRANPYAGTVLDGVIDESEYDSHLAPAPQPTPQQTGPKQFDLGAVYQQYEPQIKETASGILKGITDVGEVAERIVMPWTHFTGTESSRLQEQEGLNQYKPQHELDVLGFKTNLFDVGKMGGEAVATGGMGGVAGGARGAAVLPKMVLGGIEGATGNALIEAGEQFRERNFDPGQLAASLGIGALAGAGFGAAAHGVGTAFNKMFPKKEAIKTFQDTLDADLDTFRHRQQYTVENGEIKKQPLESLFAPHETPRLDFGKNIPEDFVYGGDAGFNTGDLDMAAVAAEDPGLAAVVGGNNRQAQSKKALFEIHRDLRVKKEQESKAFDDLILKASKEEDKHQKALFDAHRAVRKLEESEEEAAQARLKGLFDVERDARKAQEGRTKAAFEAERDVRKLEDGRNKAVFDAERNIRKVTEAAENTEARDRLKQVNEMLQRYRNQKKDKAANAKTLDKFLKHVNKVEDFNKKTSIKVKLAPNIDPVSDFLSRERQVTKTKHQTFAVEAESDISLRGRIDKAIEDGDTKAADAINEEIAKRKQNPEPHTAQEDIIPEEALQQTQQEIDAAIQVKSIDDARGYERGAIGMPIEEALEGGVINEAAAATARAFAEVQLQLKAARATVKAAGDELLKRYPEQDVFELHGMKFSRYEKDARVHLEYQDEFDDAIKDIPKGSVVRDVPENVRGTVDADPKKLVAPMEAMSDDQIVQAAGIAKAQITPLDKERKQLAQALIPHLKENRAVLKQDFENASISMEYVSPHQQHYYDTTPEQQEAAAQIQLKLKEFLEADKAYKKKDIKATGKISKAFTNKKLALTSGLSAITQFMHGQAAEAADATTKAVTAPGMLEAMSQPVTDIGAAWLAANGLRLLGQKAFKALLDSEEGAGAISASIMWKDSQDRLAMLSGMMRNDLKGTNVINLAAKRLDIQAKVNKLYFNKEMGDPDVVAKAMAELRGGAISAGEAVAGKGAFKQLKPDQRKQVLLARAYQAELAQASRKFREQYKTWEKLLEANGNEKRLRMAKHLERTLRFHESRVGVRDAYGGSNALMNLFGEYNFGPKNLKFNLMNLLTDAPILGATSAGWRSYGKALSDLSPVGGDAELKALFRHSNLAGQRKHDISETAAESVNALFRTRQAIKTVTDKIPGIDSEKVNADRYALAKTYDYFKQNQDAIKQSGFRGDAKEFAKALFSGKEALDGAVAADALAEVSDGLSRVHGVDPFGMNTNYFAEGPHWRMFTFFTKQPARTSRLMAHYVANGEWRKFNQMLAAMTLAGGSAALPVELWWAFDMVAPDKSAEFKDSLDELEIYHRLNPLRKMSPKTEYGLFIWPAMGSISPVTSEAQAVLGDGGHGSAAGALKRILTKAAENKLTKDNLPVELQKVGEKSAYLAPVPGINFLADLSKGTREIKDGFKVYGHDPLFGDFKPSQRKKFTLEMLERSPSAHLFNRMFMPGVEVEQEKFEQANRTKQIKKYAWHQK